MTEPRWLSETEMRAWLGYRRMRLHADTRIDRDMTAISGLSPRDYDVMSRLSDEADQRIRFSELSAGLHWSRSRLSHHLDRMADRGLIVRQDSPEDGRGAWVAMTESGWRKLRSAAPAHVASVRRHLLDLLTPQQVAELGDIAEAVLPGE